MSKANRCVVVTLSCIAWATAAVAQPALQAVRTDAPPKLDGSADDAVWKAATESKLEAEGRGGDAKGKKVAVTLRAAYDKENVYFLLRWQDAAKDETHKSWGWNESKGAYEAGAPGQSRPARSNLPRCGSDRRRYRTRGQRGAVLRRRGGCPQR